MTISQASTEKTGDVKAYNIDNEDWTLKKILRFFVWHDWIHGKAMSGFWRSRKTRPNRQL